MNKFTTPVIVAVAALFAAGFGLAAMPANAASNLSVTANPWPPVTGQDVTVTGTVTFSDAGQRCSSWTLTFDGDTVAGTGGAVANGTETFSHSWPVGSQSTHTASATCVVQQAVGYSGTVSSVLSASVPPTTAGHVSGRTGSLPNAGGPEAWWLIVALLALAGGFVLVTRRRRDDTNE